MTGDEQETGQHPHARAEHVARALRRLSGVMLVGVTVVLVGVSVVLVGMSVVHLGVTVVLVGVSVVLGGMSGMK